MTVKLTFTVPKTVNSNGHLLVSIKNFLWQWYKL